MTDTDTNKDIKFMSKLLGEIAEYAHENKMSVNDTIRTICENFLALLEIATFENMKGGSENET